MEVFPVLANTNQLIILNHDYYLCLLCMHQPSYCQIRIKWLLSDLKIKFMHHVVDAEPSYMNDYEYNDKSKGEVIEGAREGYT